MVQGEGGGGRCLRCKWTYLLENGLFQPESYSANVFTLARFCAGYCNPMDVTMMSRIIVAPHQECPPAKSNEKKKSNTHTHDTPRCNVQHSSVGVCF